MDNFLLLYSNFVQITGNKLRFLKLCYKMSKSTGVKKQNPICAGKNGFIARLPFNKEWPKGFANELA